MFKEFDYTNTLQFVSDYFKEFVDSSSDDDSEDEVDTMFVLQALDQLGIGGSSRRRRPSSLPRQVIHRDHNVGENLIKNHYFGRNLVYPAHIYRRRYIS